MNKTALFVTVAFLLAACGDGGNQPTPNQPGQPSQPSQPGQPSKGYQVIEVKNGGTILVKAVYKGEAPNFPAPSHDGHCHDIKLDDLVVAPDGGLKDVVIYLQDIKTGKDYPVRPQPTLDQRGCMYVPHVLLCRPRETVLIKSSDQTLHNIHCEPKNNPSLNTGMPGVGQITYTPQFPEFIRIRCDVHSWMNSWLVVQHNPYYVVTDENGVATLTDIPPGTYKLKARHLFFNRGELILAEAVTITEGQTTEVAFEFPSK